VVCSPSSVWEEKEKGTFLDLALRKHFVCGSTSAKEGKSVPERSHRDAGDRKKKTPCIALPRRKAFSLLISANERGRRGGSRALRVFRAGQRKEEKEELISSSGETAWGNSVQDVRLAERGRNASILGYHPGSES